MTKVVLTIVFTKLLATGIITTLLSINRLSSNRIKRSRTTTAPTSRPLIVTSVSQTYLPTRSTVSLIPTHISCCARLLGMSHLVRRLYRKSGLRNTIHSIYRNISSATSTARRGDYHIYLGNTVGNHKAFVLTTRGLQYLNMDDDNATFS